MHTKRAEVESSCARSIWAYLLGI